MQKIQRNINAAKNNFIVNSNNDHQRKELKKRASQSSNFVKSI